MSAVEVINKDFDIKGSIKFLEKTDDGFLIRFSYKDDNKSASQFIFMHEIFKRFERS